MERHGWDAEKDTEWTVVTIPDDSIGAIRAALDRMEPTHPPLILRSVIRAWARDHCHHSFAVIGWEVAAVPLRHAEEKTMVYRVAFEDAHDAFAFKMRWG